MLNKNYLYLWTYQSGVGKSPQASNLAQRTTGNWKKLGKGEVVFPIVGRTRHLVVQCQTGSLESIYMHNIAKPNRLYSGMHEYTYMHSIAICEKKTLSIYFMKLGTS